MAAGCLCLSSCFTTALWSQDDEECGSAGWSTEEVLGRVMLTPFTLALDMLTACVQGVFDDDDDDCERPRRRDCRR